MKTLMISLGALLVVGCGGSQKQEVLTAEERLNREIAIAESQEGNMGEFDEAATVDEEEAEFDEQSATHAMKRAALNAEDCPNTFEKSQLGDYQPGKATVSLTFINDGTVTDVSVSPYEGTPVGDCIIRAMGTVRVQQFKGPTVQKTWELEMKAPKPMETGKKK